MTTTAQLTVRFALGATVLAAYAALVATAGPGNGYEAPRQLERVALPTVVVTAPRQAQPAAVAVNAAAVNRVNLAK